MEYNPEIEKNVKVDYDPENSSHCIYVGNIPSKVAEHHVRRILFSELYISHYNMFTNKQKRYAFVTVYTQWDAIHYINKMHKRVVYGREIIARINNT